METEKAKTVVIETVRRLVGLGLVARTWGNVSVRVDASKIAITPSGLSYDTLSPDQIVVMDVGTLEYEAPAGVKPSSEKRIHALVYQKYAEAGCVVHTHQTMATVVSVRDALPEGGGEAALAAYGLPGTRKLARAVEAAFDKGRDILLARHGALTWGRTSEEAVGRAVALEESCARFVPQPHSGEGVTEAARALCERRGKKYVPAMLDDFAQIAGLRMKPGVMPQAKRPGDGEAIPALAEKNCLAWLYAGGEAAPLPLADSLLMRYMYLRKYSKKY
jgi:L-fuculose-phosphate aldolase